MAGEINPGDIVNRIIEKLGNLPSGYPNPRTFIHNFRSVVERDNVYDPEIVAIGFYNHQKDYLKDMENFKLIYLKRFLGRNKYESDNNVNDVPVKESASSTNINVTASTGRHPFSPFYVTKGKEVVEEIAGSGMEEIVGSSVKQSAGSNVKVEDNVKESAESSVNTVVCEKNSTNINVAASTGCHPFLTCFESKGKEVVVETASSSVKQSACSSVKVEGHVKESAESSVNAVVCENKNADKIVKAVVGMEERARKWYGGRTDRARGSDFVEMLVIDGCFLIELLRCYGLDNWRDPNDPIFRHESILSQLRHDIVLNENQLPFFVLNDLFEMTKSKDPKDDLIHLTLRFVEGMFLDLSIPGNLKFVKPDHLLGLIHDVWVLPFATNNVERNNQAAIGKWENINSASELQKTGIDFKISQDFNSLMDITFARKCLGAKLKIPQLNIYYETESQIRNLVAYEQYLPDGNPRYVSDYTFFLHCLINTSNDVELLRRSGIIGNWLGNDEEVSLMFNRLGKSILTSSKFSYSKIFFEVNMHYHSHRKKWWAELWREYFDGPWACAKFLAALTLLGLAISQTIFTIYPYYHPRKDS